MHPVHPGAALQQEPVELGMVLVRLPVEESLDQQAVRTRDQPGHGFQLVLPRQCDQVAARLVRLVADIERAECGPQRRVMIRRAHASTGAAASAVTVAYSCRSASTVADQPKLDACSRAPRASLARLAGAVIRSRTALA